LQCKLTMTKKKTNEKTLKDENEIPYLTKEPNIVLASHILDRMMDGDVIYMRFRTKEDDQILILVFIMYEAIDKIYDDEDFKMMKNKYRTMIFMMERKWIQKIYDRDFIYICHVEPYDKFSPSEFWIMNQQTFDDMDLIYEDKKKVAERFTIAEDKTNVPKRKGL